jgi:Pentapeptide repeats (8 copies)
VLKRPGARRRVPDEETGDDDARDDTSLRDPGPAGAPARLNIERLTWRMMMRLTLRGTMALLVMACSFPASAQPKQGCEIRPRTHCAGDDLSGRDLANVDLGDADLSNANLAGADLRGADLYNANLAGADLSNARLADANLSRSNLSGANLSGADLDGAQLRAANLSGADLSGAELGRAELTYSDLKGATWIDGRTCAEDSVGQCR